ncbi:hypothetical protein Tco_0794122 [Tanacetum coccineum]
MLSDSSGANKIYEIKDKFNGLALNSKNHSRRRELCESEARARIQKIIIDVMDDDLGFCGSRIRYTIQFRKTEEPKDST